MTIYLEIGNSHGLEKCDAPVESDIQFPEFEMKYTDAIGAALKQYLII